MIKYVLDTSAIMACYRNETGHEKVDKALALGGCVMHVANICEFCFSVPKKSGWTVAPDVALAWLNRYGIDGIDRMDRHITMLAVDVRMTVPALSLGDGIAVALASTLGVPLMVAEHVFAKVNGFARIECIRKPKLKRLMPS